MTIACGAAERCRPVRRLSEWTSRYMSRLDLVGVAVAVHIT